MPIADLLTATRDHFHTVHDTVNITLHALPDFGDYAREQARLAFHEKLHEIFLADYQPVAASAASLADKLLQLHAALTRQEDVYSEVFTDQVDLDSASQQCFSALNQTLKRILA